MIRQRMLISLLLGTGCLLAIAVALPVNRQGAAKEYEVKGRDVEGAELTVVEAGQSLQLKIAKVELDPQDRDQETYLYTVLYLDPVAQEWKNYCQPDRQNVAKAIPLEGHWDRTGAHIESEQITFACTHGVLAKCVRLGYKPWKTVQGQSLRDFHQACTRMMRADYCGNGQSHTQDGTAVDIYDRARIQTRTPKSGMVFEAAWSPKGAVLVDRPRWPDSLAQLRKECPQRLKSPGREALDPKVIQQQTDQALLFNDSFDRFGPVRLSP
jgi:ADYC domain